MKNLIYITFIFGLFVSCSSKAEKLGNNESGMPENQKLNAESEIEKRIADTDLQDKLDIVNSLFFTKEDGSSLEVKAFLDKSEKILKVEEKFVNGENGEYGTNVFYIKDEKKYASKERFEDRTGPKPTFLERVSYYDQNEKVVSSKVRKAEFEEDLDSKPFEKIDAIDCSIARAMSAINQEGEFETRFQGLVFSRNATYLTVGESKENGYTSALLIQYNNDATKALGKNQQAYLGKKIDLTFQKMVDSEGFEFQILLDVKLEK
jgi:hypothetical protein